jgi:transcription termination factor Rho
MANMPMGAVTITLLISRLDKTRNNAEFLANMNQL